VPFFLRDIVSFFVDFERAISLEAPPGVMTDVPRDVRKILELFKSYSNCEFKIFGVDFSDGLPAPQRRGDDQNHSNNRPQEIGSLIFNFGKHAEIYINTMKNTDGTYLVNFCHRRFFIIKEAFHVILRDELIRKGLGHPDTKSPEELQTLIETMIYLPFSILDLDNPKYPESERVEHAAELLALIILYPLDRIAKDRAAFTKLVGVTDFQDADIMIANTFSYADAYKVPQRYVDLAFRWHKFDELYSLYTHLKQGGSLETFQLRS
jgi:hypothetical protein